jgi:hypothetical protein
MASDWHYVQRLSGNRHDFCHPYLSPKKAWKSYEMKDQITYRAGYKYVLDKDYVQHIQLNASVSTEYICLTTKGLLKIKRGYAWDGPSGPTVDTRNFMRGALVHDVLYQLIRLGYLGKSDRLYADDLLRAMCREDGMSWLRAWWVYRAVRAFGAGSARPSATRSQKKAP